MSYNLFKVCTSFHFDSIFKSNFRAVGHENNNIKISLPFRVCALISESFGKGVVVDFQLCNL